MTRIGVGPAGDVDRELPAGLGGTREQEAQRGNRLAEQATRAIANVGHSAHELGMQQRDATAIVQVANLLAELMDWRMGRRRMPSEAVRDLGMGVIVYGKPEAIQQLEKMLAELESARRMIDELERMGWLMKAAKAAGT